MKKVLSVMVVSAFVLTAGVALAGGPGKKTGPGCPEPCQKQIDDLQSSQAQQDEQLNAHGRQLQNHEGRITDLEKNAANWWYVRLGVRGSWISQKPNIGGSYSDGAGNVITVSNAGESVDSDLGWGGSIAVCHEFGIRGAMGKFRVEAELSKQRADAEQTYGVTARNAQGLTATGYLNADYTVDVSTVFLNGYYELPVVDAFSLYFMAGVGYAKYDVNADVTGGVLNGVPFAYRANIIDGSDNVFAYKAGIGVTYNFTDQVAADLGYEYLGVADTDLADSINSHNVVASVRFKF